jgi:hypothetical protein
MFDCGSSTEIGRKCGPTHPLPILMANLIWVCLGLFGFVLKEGTPQIWSDLMVDTDFPD